jgi:hypothetical protein
VQRGGVPTGARAEPERIGGDRPQLADEQDSGDLLAQLGEQVQRRHGVLAADEPLGLQLLAAARRVLEPEVGQPRVPGPGHPELLGAGVAGHARHRVARALASSPPNQVSGASAASGASVRSLRQAVCRCGLRQSLNRLTLYPADTSASYCSRTTSCGSPSYTYCRTS